MAAQQMSLSSRWRELSTWLLPKTSCQTSITFGNLSSIKGRPLAQSTVVLDATTVVVP
jgi:hypothetical protein